MLRPWLLVVMPAAWLAAAAPADANVVWTRIDVQAQLDNQGRLSVVETHHLHLEQGGGFPLFREFGLGADQAIALHSLVRVNPDASELRLIEAEVGEDPRHFRYYPRGHAYFLVPALPPGSDVAFRFDYELLRAVSPAWAVASGPEPLVQGVRLMGPWERPPALLADWRAARPAPTRRYFLDHCVLYPSRDGPGYEVRRIDYRLELGSAWRRVEPDAPLASVQEDVQYRVRPLFEYLAEGRPAEAAWREASVRLLSVLALPVVGLLLWLALLAFEALSTRGAPPLEPASILAQLREVAPEALPVLLEGSQDRPKAAEVLERLAAERKLAVEFSEARRSQGGEDEPELEVRMHRLVPTAALPAHERAFLAHFFRDGDETSSAQLRSAYRKTGFDPDQAVASLMRERPPAPPRGLVAWLALAAGAFGVFLQMRSLRDVDFVPVLLMADMVALAIWSGWPRGWWNGFRPRRGLLVPLVVLGLGALALQLCFNRPLPADTWVGSSLIVLACHAATLLGSRMPTGGPHAELRELARIRHFAKRELRRRQPRLEDGWIAHLRGFGLERDLERWRARHGDGQLGTPFTGRALAPQSWPPYWTGALYVEGASEDER